MPVQPLPFCQHGTYRIFTQNYFYALFSGRKKKPKEPVIVFHGKYNNVEDHYEEMKLCTHLYVFATVWRCEY